MGGIWIESRARPRSVLRHYGEDLCSIGGQQSRGNSTILRDTRCLFADFRNAGRIRGKQCCAINHQRSRGIHDGIKVTRTYFSFTAIRIYFHFYFRMHAADMLMDQLLRAVPLIQHYFVVEGRCNNDGYDF